MKTMTREELLYNIAIDMLVQGKVINECAFNSLIKSYTVSSFENNVKKSIKKHGKKSTSLMKVLEKLTESAILTKDARIMFEVAKKIQGVSIHKLAGAIIKTNRIQQIEDIALLPGAPINELAKQVCEQGTNYSIISFARDVPGAPIDLLEDELIKKVFKQGVQEEYKEEIINFAKKVPKANISKLQNVIISTNNANLIYKFACEVKKVNVDKCVDALIDLKATGFYEDFVKKVPNVKKEHIEKFAESMKENEANPYYIIAFSSIEKCPEYIARDLIEYAITQEIKY